MIDTYSVCFSMVMMFTQCLYSFLSNRIDYSCSIGTVITC